MRAAPRVRVAVRAIALAAGLLAGAPARAGGDAGECVAHEPDDYRMTAFRAPVPCTLAGATVLDTAALAALRRPREGAPAPVLIDVLPAPRRPPGAVDGGSWLPLHRDGIPGSVWLPNTGFGVLPVEEERYLRDNLRRLTGGDRARALVFFCERDCWMSWNAARRAVRWGHAAVYWYPDGTDGWRDAGHALAPVTPVPREAGQ